MARPDSGAGPGCATALLPSMIGHLKFGAMTALTFLLFERGYSRWLLLDPRHVARPRVRKAAGRRKSVSRFFNSSARSGRRQHFIFLHRGRQFGSTL